MKMNQTIGTTEKLDVLMTCKVSDRETLVLMHHMKGEYSEYVVGFTADGETWSHGQYFHAANYGGKPDAYSAAYLQFNVRAGMNSVISRAARSGRPDVQRLLIDLRIIPDRRAARLAAPSLPFE